MTPAHLADNVAGLRLRRGVPLPDLSGSTVIPLLIIVKVGSGWFCCVSPSCFISRRFGEGLDAS